MLVFYLMKYDNCLHPVDITAFVLLQQYQQMVQSFCSGIPHLIFLIFTTGRVLVKT